MSTSIFDPLPFKRAIGAFLIFIIAAIAAIGLGKEFLRFSNIHQHIEPGLRQAANLDIRRNEVKLIVLGDSMLAMAYNPETSDKFNFAAPGDKLEDMREKADYAIAAAPHLKTVVVQFHQQSYSAERQRTRPTYRFAALPIVDGRPLASCRVDRCCNDGTTISNLRCRSRRAVAELKAAEMPRLGEPRPQANGFAQFQLQRMWALSGNLPPADMTGQTTEFRPQDVEVFANLIARLREAGKKIVLAIPPVHPSARNAYELFFGQTQIELLKKYKFDENIDGICDASELTDERSDYLNASHLIGRGVHAYTQFLDTCIANLNVSFQ